MLVAGTDAGLFRLSDFDGADESSVRAVLDAGSVARIRRFEAFDGVFAATESGLYHSRDGTAWKNLNVPREKVYAVGATPDGRLLAGTRPAHLYVGRTGDGGPDAGVEWTELAGFQDLPSRDDWRLPRHENLAQVRDVHVDAAAPDRVVAGVEVGGVHVSEDGGETWQERREGVHDDVHELLVSGSEFVAATGFGLFRSTDEGRTWTRLDEGYDQRYFRSVCAVDGDVYAGGALAHTSTWVEDDADPALFVSRDGESLEPVDHPRPGETVTGIAGVDDTVVAATHRGTVLTGGGDGWSVAGSLPRRGDDPVSYTPLCWVEE